MAQGGPGVRHLVAIDREHNIFVPQFMKAFPDAKVYVPTGVRDNWAKSADKKDLVDKISFVFGQGQGDPFEAETNGEIKSVDFGKSHGNEVRRAPPLSPTFHTGFRSLSSHPITGHRLLAHAYKDSH